MATVTETYTLPQFVEDLRRLAAASADTNELITRTKPFAARLAASPDLQARCRKECDPEQGFGFQLLHEEPDHDLAVALLSWLPGRGTPPHDHGTWGVVVGVEGDEVNTFYKRVDDGSRAGHAELKKLSEKVFGPGDVLGITPAIIHSVHNATDKISVSLAHLRPAYQLHAALEVRPRAQQGRAFRGQSRLAEPLPCAAG
jgi:predicted metal-dependent enzyme (double-stranded beta helix superfamily)